jgi:hypothetical protein
MKEFLLFMLGMMAGIVTLGMLQDSKSTLKPISYPEEIQAVRAGDTLYVSSVSDSIYIGFKHK